jgi:hypothetical protein
VLDRPDTIRHIVGPLADRWEAPRPSR